MRASPKAVDPPASVSDALPDLETELHQPAPSTGRPLGSSPEGALWWVSPSTITAGASTVYVLEPGLLSSRFELRSTGINLGGVGTDVPYEETLASMAKTLGVALGIDEATLDSHVGQGRPIPAALASSS